MEESRLTEERALPPWLARLAGVAALIAGIVLVGRLDRTGVTGGILLLVAALGLIAAGWGQGAYGPEVEGPLDLSTRLSVGLLGGALGGLAYLGVAWLGGAAGFPDLFGSELAVHADPARWASAAARGAVWGVLFGVALPWISRRDPVWPALLFSLLPSLWTAVVVFPRLEFGLFGARLGALTLVPIVVYHLFWGLVVGGTLRWAAETGEAPLSRRLGA